MRTTSPISTPAHINLGIATDLDVVMRPLEQLGAALGVVERVQDALVRTGSA